MKNYKSPLFGRKTDVTSLYNPKLKWNAILPTVVYSYLMEKLSTEPPFKHFKLNIALYYLSLIFTIPRWKKDKKYLGGYIPLHSLKLKKINYNYKQYFDYFLKINLLQSKNYSVGHFSKSYRYNFNHILKEGKRKIDLLELSSIKIDNKKVINLENKQEIGVCPHLTKFFNENLKLDSEKLLENLSQSDLFEYNKYAVYSKKYFNTVAKAENYIFSLTMMKDQIFRWTRSIGSDNRLHTNLTNMPKIFRNFVTYNAQNLISIDIKNSQPFFLVFLIDKLFVNKNIERIIRKVYGKSYMCNMLQKLKEISTSKDFQREYEILKNEVLQGTYYELLMNTFDHLKPAYIKMENNKPIEFYEYKFYDENLKTKISETFKGKRNLVKKIALQILYCPLTKPSVEYKKFTETFPNLTEFINILKTSTTDKDSYKKFPQLLQNIEADCILDFVTKNISKEYPDMPMFTIHDSIATTEEYLPILEELVKQYFSEYCDGLLPKFETEYWCNDCDNKLIA